MRILSLLVLFAAATSIPVLAQNVPITSDYERRKPPADTASLPPALIQELTAIRDAGLTDDYAYQQVAHLTENIGPRPSVRRRRRLRSNMSPAK